MQQFIAYVFHLRLFRVRLKVARTEIWNLTILEEEELLERVVMLQTNYKRNYMILFIENMQTTIQLQLQKMVLNTEYMQTSCNMM